MQNKEKYILCCSFSFHSCFTTAVLLSLFYLYISQLMICATPYIIFCRSEKQFKIRFPFIFEHVFSSTVVEIWMIENTSFSYFFFFNPLTAKPLSKMSLFYWCKKLWNAITGDWLKLIAKFSIPFCSKFYPLSKTLTF